MDEAQGIKETFKPEATPLTATATIETGTRVSYTVNEKEILQQWEVGDVIQCVDNVRHMFKFTVESVDENGVAKIKSDEDYSKFVYNDANIKVQTADTVFAVYYPAAKMTESAPTYNGNEYDYVYRVNFDLTKGLTGNLDPDTTGAKARIPLLATAAISNDMVSFKFKPVGAVVALKGFNAAPNAKINKVVVSGFSTVGSYVWYVTFNKKTFKQTKQKNAVEIAGNNDLIFQFDEPLVCDAEGKCATDLYFPILQSKSANITVMAYSTDGTVYADKFSTTFDAGVYYYTTRNLKPLTEGVVTVNGKNYFTFDDAVEAANATEGDVEVKLLEDITLQSQKFFTYQPGKLILNLNNHKITGSVTSTSDSPKSCYQSMITVFRSADFIGGGENGMIRNNGGRALSIDGAAVSVPLNITFDGGTYYSSESYGVVAGGKDANDNRCVILVKSGKFYSATNAAFQVGGWMKASSATIKIESGEFDAPKGIALRLNGNASEAEILGGTFSGKNSVQTNSAESSLIVHDGIFNATDQVINNSNAYKVFLEGGYYKTTSTGDNQLILANTIKGVIRVTGGYFSCSGGLIGEGNPDEEQNTTIYTGYKIVPSTEVESYAYKIVPIN